MRRFLTLLFVFALSVACTQPVHYGGDEPGPSHCSKYVHQHYAVSDKHGDWAAVMAIAAEFWHKKTDGCVLITVEMLPEKQVENRKCYERALYVKGIGPKLPDGARILGTATGCIPNGGYITVYEDSIGPRLDYRTAVMEHEIGHAVGFLHRGEEKCLMFHSAWPTTRWCETDELQCRELGYCLPK